MTTQTDTTNLPSKAALIKATGLALVVALVLLFTVVLPAEYGVDPLKTGAMLGLTAISESEAPEASAAPVVKGAYTAEAKVYKVDAEDFLLQPGQGVEMKYHMQKGASMVYSWKSDGKLAFEFHGEPDQKPNKDYYESYELDRAGKDTSYGTFTAPSTGIHGWFFENISDKEVRFRLTVAGFFDSAKMFAGGPPEDIVVDDVQ